MDKHTDVIKKGQTSTSTRVHTFTHKMQDPALTGGGTRGTTMLFRHAFLRYLILWD